MHELKRDMLTYYSTFLLGPLRPTSLSHHLTEVSLQCPKKTINSQEGAKYFSLLKGVYFLGTVVLWSEFFTEKKNCFNLRGKKLFRQCKYTRIYPLPPHPSVLFIRLCVQSVSSKGIP